MNPQDYAVRAEYRPPAEWYRRLNKAGWIVVALGLAPDDVVVLEVPGRRSGKRRRTLILTTPVHGQEYLVALAGESQWVRNVRAAGGEVVIRRRRPRHARLVEIPGPERSAVIAEYLRRAEQRGGAAAAARQARFYFGLRPDPHESDIEPIVDFYPVFRIDHES